MKKFSVRIVSGQPPSRGSIATIVMEQSLTGMSILYVHYAETNFRVGVVESGESVSSPRKKILLVAAEGADLDKPDLKNKQLKYITQFPVGIFPAGVYDCAIFEAIDIPPAKSTDSPKQETLEIKAKAHDELITDIDNWKKIFQAMKEEKDKEDLVKYTKEYSKSQPF